MSSNTDLDTNLDLDLGSEIRGQCVRTQKRFIIDEMGREGSRRAGQ